MKLFSNFKRVSYDIHVIYKISSQKKYFIFVFYYKFYYNKTFNECYFFSQESHLRLNRKNTLNLCVPQAIILLLVN